jgi:hypothetical protein
MIELDVPNRRLHLDIPDEELARRLAAWKPNHEPAESGYAWLHQQHVQGADTGADLDFLKGCRGNAVGQGFALMQVAARPSALGKIALDQHAANRRPCRQSPRRLARSPSTCTSRRQRQPPWRQGATASRPGPTSRPSWMNCPGTSVVSLCLPPVPRFAYAEAALQGRPPCHAGKTPGARPWPRCRNWRRWPPPWASRSTPPGTAAWPGRSPARAWLAGRRDHPQSPHHLARGCAQMAPRPGLGVRTRRHGRLRSRHQRPVDPDRDPAPPRPPDQAATLEFPENRQTPIAARLTFSNKVSADFDWRQEGPQTWDISVQTDQGHPRAPHGRQPVLEIDGRVMAGERIPSWANTPPSTPG